MSFARQGIVETTPPAGLPDGQERGFSFTADGKARVDATVTVEGAAGGTSSSFNAAFPATGTAIGATDGANMKPIKVDGFGNLLVNVAAGAASGTEYADGAARGSATGTLMMGDDGTNIQSLAVDTAGKLKALLDQYTPVGGKLPVDGSGVTQPISAASLPLPTGAATATNQATIIGHLADIDARKLEEATWTGRVGEVQASPTANTLLGRLKSIEDKLAATLTVGGSVTANAGTNLNTSALALESGGNLAAAATALQVLDDWDETDRAKVNIVVGQAGITAGAGAVAANTPRVTLASDDPAVVALQILDNIVSGNEAQVDVLTLPALPAGTNNIGDVDIASITAGDNLIGRVKLSDGTDVATVRNVTGANALDVAIVDASGNHITSFGGGTQYTEGDTDASIAGTAMLWEDTSDTLRAVSADKPLPVNVVLGGAGDGAILDGVSSAIKATVLDYANANPLAVRLSDTNGDYVAAGAGTQYTEDAAAAADPVGGMLMAVRADSPAAVTNTDGDNIALRATNKGEVYVKHIDAIPVTDNSSSLTVDAPVGTPVFVRLSDGSSAISTLPVSLASVPSHAVTNAGTFAVQESGAALAALQLLDDTVATTASAIPGKGFAISGTDGTNARVVKVDSSGELQVDVLTLPNVTIGAAIPAGTNNIGDVDVLTVPTDPFGANSDAAATAGSTGSMQAKFRLMTSQLDSIKTAVELLDNTVGGSELQVDIVGALPAGTNAIGKLAANSGVDIGDVDITSIAAGSNLIGDVNLQARTGGGGTSIFRSLDLDESEEEIKASAGAVYGYAWGNTNASARFLKFYNATAANVTVGTTTPVLTMYLPPTSAGHIAWDYGIPFSTAITAAATTGIADNDTGAPGANEVSINVFYK